MTTSQANRTIAIGDPVLIYGELLQVTALEDKNGILVAKCENVAGAEARAAAIAEERELRGRQWAHFSREEQAKHHEAVEKATAAARKALVKFGLRADLLAWWDEKECWVSDGRILSDAQAAAWQKRFGQKPLPRQQREVYLALEQLDG